MPSSFFDGHVFRFSFFLGPFPGGVLPTLVVWPVCFLKGMAISEVAYCCFPSLSSFLLMSLCQSSSSALQSTSSALHGGDVTRAKEFWGVSSIDVRVRKCPQIIFIIFTPFDASNFSIRHIIIVGGVLPKDYRVRRNMLGLRTP